MTFTEAAEAVLKKLGKPLHYKKITQLAIEQNLLSHVGKTPEVTMSTRLATLTKKDRGEAAIVRVKPGVFGLRDWGATADDAADEETDAEEPAEPVEAAEGEDAKDAPAAAAAAAAEAKAGSPEERERAQRLAAGSQLFPAEDDDDLPVLGGPDRPAPVPAAATPAGDAAAATGEARGRRRRRRRRGRGSDREGAPGLAAGEGGSEEAGDFVDGDEGDDAPLGDETRADDGGAEGGLAAHGEGGLATVAGEAGEGAIASQAGGEPTSRLPEWKPRPDRAPREDRGPREERAMRDDRGPREERAMRDDRGMRDDVREEVGREAADLIVSLLARREDRQGVPLRTLAEDGIRQGKLQGESGFLAPTLSAAARADGARREARGERPRLRVSNGRVGLVDWALGPDFVRAEADALIALERLRDTARRQLIRRMNELPQPAFTELVVLLLERMGISSMRPARRPGLPQGEVHLAGIARRAGEEMKVAVMIKRGGEIGRERVIELRGSLHHYGPAGSAWLVTTGNVLSGAREEASQQGTMPVTLIDGVALGRLFDEHAVGVKHATVPVPYPDLDLLDSLRS